MNARYYLSKIDEILKQKPIMMQSCEPEVMDWLFSDQVRAKTSELNEDEFIKSHIFKSLTRTQQIQVIVNIAIEMLKINIDVTKERLLNNTYPAGVLKEMLDRILATPTNDQGDILLNHIDPDEDINLDMSKLKSSTGQGTISFAMNYSVYYLSTLVSAINKFDTQMLKEIKWN